MIQWVKTSEKLGEPGNEFNWHGINVKLHESGKDQDCVFVKKKHCESKLEFKGKTCNDQKKFMCHGPIMQGKFMLHLGWLNFIW